MEKKSKQPETINSTQMKDIEQSKKYCILCGADLNRGKQFCSATCRNKARVSKLPKTNCLNCGKEISIERKNRPTKFCSTDCRHQHRTKNSNSRYEMWNKIREEVKGKYKQCQKCKATTNLHVHHIDHNTRNNELNNLIVLCQSCHMSYHRQHDYHQTTLEQFMILK